MEEEEGLIQGLDKEALILLAAGCICALLAVFIPFTRQIGSYLVILIHEAGHAIFGWFYGFVSIPAFDFQYGGGVTSRFAKRHWILVAVMIGVMSWFIYLNRKSPHGIALFASLLLIYLVTTFTGLHVSMITAMGHGFELFVATVFLYRGLSGSLISEHERPVYAFCGIFICFYNMQFSWKLLHHDTFRIFYKNHPAGHKNDFIKLAQSSGLSLEMIAIIFMLGAVLVPAVAILFHRYRRYI